MAGNYPQQPRGPQGQFQQPGYGAPMGGYQQPGYGAPQGGYRPPMPPRKKKGSGNIVIWVVCSILTVGCIIGAIWLMVDADAKGKQNDKPIDAVQAVTYLMGGNFTAPSFMDSPFADKLDEAAKNAIMAAQRLPMPKRNAKIQETADYDQYLQRVARQNDKVTVHHEFLKEMDAQYQDIKKRANSTRTSTNAEVEQLVVDILELQNKLVLVKHEGKINHVLLKGYIDGVVGEWVRYLNQYSAGKTNFEITSAKERIRDTSKKHPLLAKDELQRAMAGFLNDRATYPTLEDYKKDAPKEYEMVLPVYSQWSRDILARFNSDNQKYMDMIDGKAKENYEKDKAAWDAERTTVNAQADEFVTKTKAMVEAVEAIVRAAGLDTHQGVVNQIQKTKDRIDQAANERYTK